MSQSTSSADLNKADVEAFIKDRGDELEVEKKKAFLLKFEKIR